MIACMNLGHLKLPSPEALILALDESLRVCFQHPVESRPNPADSVPDVVLKEPARRHAAGLMRVNHTGEVCAQGLYQGQALLARDPDTRSILLHAADEELDHLAWCRNRLHELQDRPSHLDPVWYVGSFVLGVGSSLLGDRWNMAFLVETERQVEAHLVDHLKALPPEDLRSRAVVDVMKTEEIEHAEMAKTRGAEEMPETIRGLMKLTAKIMTTVAYRL